MMFLRAETRQQVADCDTIVQAKFAARPIVCPQLGCQGARPRARLARRGECGRITELAAAEKIDRSYLCRVLRLTLLAPEIVEAIMDGRQVEWATLPALMKGFPVKWEGQISTGAEMRLQ